MSISSEGCIMLNDIRTYNMLILVEHNNHMEMLRMRLNIQIILIDERKEQI